MPDTIDKLRSFYEFVGRQLARPAIETPSPQECLDLWFSENHSLDDSSEALQAIRQGLNDMYGGRTRPAEDVLHDLCRKHDLPVPQ